MKAWIGERSGSVARYREADVPDPAPAPDEVVLRVHAAGLNLADRFPKRRHFEHSAPLPVAIPGLEAAGEIEAVGRSVRSHRPGERVMAQEVIDTCLQFFGGYGYMLEYPVCRAFMDARVARIFAGTNEIMRIIVAKQMNL